MSNAISAARVHPAVPLSTCSADVVSSRASTAAPATWPTWETLFGGLYTGDTPHARAVRALREDEGQWAFRFAQLVVFAILRDPAMHKYHSTNRDDVIDIMADQALRNHELLAAGLPRDLLAPMAELAGGGSARAFHQMPCTRATVLARVEKTKALCKKDDPILLLGDDDMVSIELARAGFTDITALDIDPRVTRKISHTVAAEGNSVRLLEHDLATPPPTQHVRPYRLTFVDPIYSPAGIRLFLQAAENFSGGQPGAILLSANLGSLFRPGLIETGQVVQALGLRVREVQPGFNAYPAPLWMRGWLHILNRFIFRSRTLASDGWSLPYFFSDAVLLERGPR